MEYLEKQNSWKEPDFDTVLQYLRTILLRRTHSPLILELLVADIFQMVLPSHTPLKTHPHNCLLSFTLPLASHPS